MKYEKYKTNGWGLSELSLIKINELVSDNKNKTVKVIEFGSGKSTEFMVDLNNEIDKKIVITSFDNDPNWAYKPKKGDGVNLLMRPLLECSDEAYELMFKDKTYDRSNMNNKKTALTTRQKNNFYDVKEGDITGKYDLMILDGPNGNGRNFSFLHMKEHMKSGGYILVDDYTHYDFVERMVTIFDGEIIFEDNDNDSQGVFVIYKIK